MMRKDTILQPERLSHFKIYSLNGKKLKKYMYCQYRHGIWLKFRTTLEQTWSYSRHVHTKQAIF